MTPEDEKRLKDLLDQRQTEWEKLMNMVKGDPNEVQKIVHTIDEINRNIEDME